MNILPCQDYVIPLTLFPSVTIIVIVIIRRIFILDVKLKIK